MSEKIDQPETSGVESKNAVMIDGRPVTRAQLEDMKSSAKRIELFAKIMDTYGLDALIGLLAGAGDMGSALLSGYIVVEAIRHGVGKGEIAKMVSRLGLDVVIGLVPILGDFIDLIYKANKANAKAFERHVKKVESHFSPETIQGADKKVLVAVERGKVEKALTE